jgi:hypothetical protein
MNEETYRKWDVTLKLFAPLLTVLALLVSVWQFTREQRAQIERQYQLIAQNDMIEFKRRLYDKQLDVYMKISTVVGRIASTDQNKDQLMKDIEQFYSLYWGEMIYVADENVEKAMIDFHVEIQDFLKGIGTKDRLKERGYNLIQVCRESSKKTWLTESAR